MHNILILHHGRGVLGHGLIRNFSEKGVIYVPIGLLLEYL